MRSKEVDNAVEKLNDFAYKNGWLNVRESKTLLNYISELEKENEKYKNFQLHISGMRSGKELLTRYIKDSILKIR